METVKEIDRNLIGTWKDDSGIVENLDEVLIPSKVPLAKE
jgi:hypothetical protein